VTDKKREHIERMLTHQEEEAARLLKEPDIVVRTPDGDWHIWSPKHDVEDAQWMCERSHRNGRHCRARSLAAILDWLGEEILRTCF
jgi:hypothetical protein